MPRQYDWRHRCPYCQRLYAKKKKWVDHIRGCPAHICGVRFRLGSRRHRGSEDTMNEGVRVTVHEVHVPLGSSIGVGRAVSNGQTIWFGGDYRPMLDLLTVVMCDGPQEAEVEPYQVISDMGLVCETIDHDWEAVDIADGVVGAGAAHVWRIYCTRCDAEGTPEDME